MTPPPSSRAVARAASSPSVPDGFLTVDESFLQDYTQTKPEKIRASFEKFDLKGGISDGLLQLFKERNVKLNLKFHETEIPVDGAPDLKIIEGAQMCMGLSAHDGQLSMSRPAGLQGFQALGGFINFCQIEALPGDRLKMSECPCALPYSRDITDEVMGSPLGVLFPDRHLKPVPLKDLLKLDLDGGAGGGGLGDKILRGLHALSAKIETDVWEDDPPGTPGGTCHPIWAGLELFFDLPVLQKTIAEEKYRLFDFSGLLEGSSLAWPGFDLSALPLPDGLRIESGKADLSWRYHPTDSKTEIQLKNLEAELLIPELFGEEKVRVKGGVSVILQSGGLASLHFDGLNIELASFPSGEKAALRLSGKLSGDLLLKPDPVSKKTGFSEAHLKLDEIRLSSLPEKGLRMGLSGAAWKGEVQGSLEVDFVPSHPTEPLHLKADLKGFLEGVMENQHLDLNPFTLHWEGGFQRVAENYIPSLENSKGEFRGNLQLSSSNSSSILMAEDFSISLSHSRLEAKAKTLQVGKLDLEPFLGVDLHSKREGENFKLDGEGEFSLLSPSLPLRFGSPLRFSTDLKNLDWEFWLKGENVLGPILASGEARIKGGGDLSQGLLSSLQKFDVKTLRPFELRKDAQVLAKNVTLSGKGDSKGLSLQVHIPSLLSKMGVDLTLGRRSGSNHLWGAYAIRPRSMEIHPDFTLRDFSVRGGFTSSPLTEFFEKPKIYLNGSAKAQVSGFLNGPVSSSYRGSLSYQPDKERISLWLDPKASRITLGPLSPAGESLSFEGKADLQGTYILHSTKHGWAFGGSQTGFKNGNLLFDADGPKGEDPIPLLSGLSLLADQLWDIRKGIAYGGGSGIRFETDLHLKALQDGIPTSSETRHIVYIADQLPLSTEGYWRLFKKMQADSQKGGR